MAKRRLRLKVPHVPLVAWAVLIFFGVSSAVVLWSHHEQQQAVQEQADQLALEASKTAAQKADKLKFIKRIAPFAQKNHRQYGVLASITMAQAILESDWGRSQLAADYHNFFGIKGTDPANTKLLRTKEYVNDEWQTVSARFRVFQTDEASFDAHARLFVNGTDWNPQQYKEVLAAQTYETAANALKQDGYATDPDYPQKLISLIELWNLDQYDV